MKHCTNRFDRWVSVVTFLFLPFVLDASSGWAQEFSFLNAEELTAEKKLIKRILERQTEAWNQGNLEQFMKTYWKSNSLTFSAGGRTTRGWQETLSRYQKSYSPPNEMGVLSFDELEITMLESRSALVLGNWRLVFSDGKKRGGNFSLVLHKFNDQWRIIHDHSSNLEERPDTPNPTPTPQEPGE